MRLFMNKFRQMGFIDYSRRLEIQGFLLNVVQHGQPRISGANSVGGSLIRRLCDFRRHGLSDAADQLVDASSGAVLVSHLAVTSHGSRGRRQERIKALLDDRVAFT